MAELFELLLASIREFGVVITLVAFILAGVGFYAFKVKTKTEKLLNQVIMELSKQNQESMQSTRDSITEIKNLSISVLESVKELNGEIRGIVSVVKYLIADNQHRNDEEE